MAEPARILFPSGARAGMGYGFLGVLCFSLTLPATRLAVASFNPMLVGLARGLVASVPAALVLLLARPRRPKSHQWLTLCVIASGAVLGFPLLTAWAMTRLPASHGAVVLGFLPLATAVLGAVRAGERPSLGFWAAAAAGTGVVLLYVTSAGVGSWHWGDMALIGAVACAAVAYAEGGILARSLGGWQVICWALVIAAPVLIGPVTILVIKHPLPAAPVRAWVGLGYVCLFSMFIGFFAWYRGLALGGVSQVSQLQLLQPFLTLLAAAALLGEHITWRMVVAALAVIGCIVMGRRASR